jgi:PhnB protein
MTEPKTVQSAITPYLCCRDAAGAIDFYKRAFGAVEEMRLAEPTGRIGHAELRIAGASIMLSDEYPEMNVLSPQSIGGSPVAIHLYVDDVDEVAAQAVAVGAVVLRPIADQFYGDRTGTFEDPYGHRWFIATHVEELSAAELQRRFDEMTATEKGE